MAVVAITVLSIRREQQTFQAELQNQAHLLVDTLSSTTADRLYYLDQEFLAGMMQRLGDDQIIVAGRIYDAQGRIVADAHDSQVAYNIETDPFGTRLVQSDTPVFEWQSDKLLAGQPVLAGRERLGAIAVTLSAEPLRAKMDAVRMQGLSVALAAALIGMLLALLFSRSIIGPLQSLTEATKRIAGGELTHQITIRSGDELGLLAHSFNDMAAELALSQQKLERWNQTLERTVDQRTTELVRAMAVAQEARVTAEQANQLKSQFLANMSHELRTPLNAIINFARILGSGMRGPTNEAQQDYLNRIRASGEHLLGIINDILDLSKIEAGRMELFTEPCQIGELVQSTLSTAVGLTKGKPVTLHHEIGAELPTLIVDRTRIRQVLLNLLSNAAKFTDEGSITVRVAQEQDEVVVSVADTGIGIPADKYESIFEEFRQVDHGTARSYEGTGLGLAICRRLVALHGGRIWVESKIGSGSTFSFSLPTHGAVPQRIDPPKEGLISAAAGRPTILVIDDDTAAIEIVASYLQQDGYVVQGVTDSRRAMDIARHIQPAAIILDILMPYKDGWELLAELKADPVLQSVPVILYTIVEEQKLGMHLGANAYLVKPIDETQLRTTVNQLVAHDATILVVDDDPNVLEIVHQQLTQMNGFRVITANGGQAGLDAIAAHRPDLIVLDLMMPDVDGFAVLTVLDRDPKTRGIPVIVLTAKDLTRAERDYLNERVQSFLSKGATPAEELLGRIHALLQHCMATTNV
jgi:signal transduction histidine kinase/CheY-like chemotaxis protein